VSQGGFGLRRRSREMALQLLFQTEFVQGGFKPTAAPEMLRRFNADFQIDAEVSEYGGKLFLGVSEKMAEIDGIIQAHSSHWKVSRMGLVDLSVMRVAIFEMKFLAEPLNPRIAIDEAVEVAKKYGSTDSGAFVNGILDHVARGLNK
jgi:transcription antitermination protein NusB